MSIKLGVIMDPIERIKIHKDSTFAMLLAAQKRNWSLFYMQQSDLFQRDGVSYAHMQALHVSDDASRWFSKNDAGEQALHDLDILLMRVDPPFDSQYLYTTHLLDRAEQLGCLVINKASSLRDINEKLFIAQFADYCVPTLVSSNQAQITHFLQEHKTIIVKPLDGMGGKSIFMIQQDDPNTGVILETMTENGTRTIMAQRYIPEIKQGDKRILLIDGEPIPYAYARIPKAGEHRGNLAAGGHGEGRKLSVRDKAICASLGPVLKQKGVLFAGIDVIGDYLTEINVTSPTCIRELDALYQLDIAGHLLDIAQTKLG